MWEQVVEKTTAFFDKPVPIIGCTIGFLLITVLTIISKTSFGKKSIRRLTELARLTHETVETTLKNVNDKLNEIDEKQDDIEYMLCDRLQAQEKRIYELETLLTEICKNIRNAKIKALINDYNKGIETVEKEKEVSENGEK